MIHHSNPFKPVTVQFEMGKKVKIPERFGYITAFMTMRCNLACSYCLNNISNSKDFNRTRYFEISGKEWVDALNKIESRPEVPITFSGGEPFLHKDFIYILNNLKSELNIDILTNLKWGEKGIGRFISQVDPSRIKRNSPYASIRVSYHPEQMGDGSELVGNVKRLKDEGFSIGIWSVLYPSPPQLSAINQMQFRCRDSGIEFSLKEFTGEYNGELYGDYSKFKDSVLQADTKKCLCRTSELLIGPAGEIYRCHRDVYAEENSVGSLLDPNFEIKDDFIECDKYGNCHPCDVKVKTDYKQRLGHTSVDIKEVR